MGGLFVHQQVFKDLLLSCVLLQTAIKSTELHSRTWKMLQGFPHMGKVHRSHISWGTKCVCVHVDTCADHKSWLWGPAPHL